MQVGNSNERNCANKTGSLGSNKACILQFFKTTCGTRGIKPPLKPQSLQFISKQGLSVKAYTISAIS